MYGTVARMNVKPGMESQLDAEMKTYESLNIDGFVGTTVFRMDGNPNEYYMAVVFRDKASYMKNADDPAQDARYQRFRALLTGDPEWHDGEVVSRAGK
jgi:quinol monooxygenase YgiN